MAKLTFGFHCGSFSVALSGNDMVLPGSMDQPLKRSLVPVADMNDTAGPYTIRVKSNGSWVCDLPVHVYWVGHSSQPEPFLGIKSDNSAELRASLAVYQGSSVELEFIPR